MTREALESAKHKLHRGIVLSKPSADNSNYGISANLTIAEAEAILRALATPPAGETPQGEALAQSSRAMQSRHKRSLDKLGRLDPVCHCYPWAGQHRSDCPFRGTPDRSEG